MPHSRPLRCYRPFLLAGALSLTLFGVASAAQAEGPYHVDTKWKVGGEGGWDYLAVDPNAPRLYITHGTRVEVIDTGSGKPVGDITGLKGVHGVVFDSGKNGYISDGKANEVVVFDRDSLKKIASIPVGSKPDALLYEPATKTVWSFNGGSNNASVIDTSTQKVVGTVDLGGRPEFPVADGKGMIYDNLEDKNSVVRVDAKAKKLTATWPLSGCDSPSGLAIDKAEAHLFAVCDGKKMAVVDAKTGKTIANPTIGEGPDAAGFDPAHKLAFSSNGDGTLTVIDASKSNFPVVQNVTTQRGSRTMAFDPKNGKIYLATAELGPRPAPTAENPHPRPSITPGSFSVIVLSR
jgi:YVTN family beta-propeller protein